MLASIVEAHHVLMRQTSVVHNQQIFRSAVLLCNKRERVPRTFFLFILCARTNLPTPLLCVRQSNATIICFIFV